MAETLERRGMSMKVRAAAALTQSPQPVICLDQVTKSYGTVQALRGVSLRIEAGESVALLGPNGAGKTTAISLMLGLLRPSTGRVLLNGGDPTISAVRRAARLGAMLQNARVIDLVRVRELLDVFRSYYAQSLPTDELLEIAQLREKQRSYTQHLSGGELQRLLFALALAGNPRLLFLDEPTAGMDVASRRRFLQRLRELHRDGRTIILTTHNLADVEGLSQRVIVLNEGRIVADGSCEAIRAMASGQVVSFLAEEPNDQLLGAIPGVLRLERQGPRVVLFTRDSDALLTELRRRGMATPHLEIRGASLEEAFLALTRKEDKA
uniref:ABC transporter ATP-binding protein n=1 Tax=Thermogemmatispora argillosa TaxID=2045280 RepID=A0A455SX51_9CHLR|nr:ABC transporter ATP-binding protein [Thermogemmatispora argillosa]